MSHCAEYNEWMELNKGVKKGKRFVLFDCEGYNKGCSGCKELDKCDFCNSYLCYYLAKCIDGNLLCPECWESYGCEEDDRLKETEFCTPG